MESPQMYTMHDPHHTKAWKRLRTALLQADSIRLELSRQDMRVESLPRQHVEELLSQLERDLRYQANALTASTLRYELHLRQQQERPWTVKDVIRAAEQ